MMQLGPSLQELAVGLGSVIRHSMALSARPGSRLANAASQYGVQLEKNEHSGAPARSSHSAPVLEPEDEPPDSPPEPWELSTKPVDAGPVVLVDADSVTPVATAPELDDSAESGVPVDSPQPKMRNAEQTHAPTDETLQVAKLIALF